MKKHLALISGLFIISQTFAQENLKKETPFTYELTYVGDVVSNIQGGISSGTNYLGMTNLMIGFSSEKAGWWKGGEFFFNGANTHGGEPTANLIGDFQTVSNIEAGDLTYIHEFWYKQSIGTFDITIGLQDLNVEFAATDFGGAFVNSSFGIHSTIADNIPSPIFPLTRPGITINWQFLKNFGMKAAAYDGLVSDYEGNNYNTNWQLTTNEGQLIITEFVFSPTLLSDKTGNYKLGVYSHNFKNSENELVNSAIENRRGFYLVADQEIIKNKNREGGLAVFTQLGLSNSKENNHHAYFGIGLNYTGLFKKREHDELILGVANTWFKNSVNGNESAIELGYRAVLGEHFFVQPDFQYIINPAGTDNKLNDALVGILRFGINF